jgi:hypothetical protein
LVERRRTFGAADVTAAIAADESRIAVDSRLVGLAVPADRFGAHAISGFLKPVSPRISRMTRMGKAARGVYGRRSASEVLSDEVRGVGVGEKLEFRSWESVGGPSAQPMWPRPPPRMSHASPSIVAW